MSTTVLHEDDARSRVLKGAEILYNAVKTTLGPKGRNVIIHRGLQAPIVTHDGVTVAKGVELSNEDDMLGYRTGADLIKQAASKMNDVAGDGTTTVTVLTYHLLNEANKLIAAGHNPMLLKKGLDMAAKDALNALEAFSEEITAGSPRVAQIASISAGDAEIGHILADVIEKVGKDGIVTVEEGQGLNMASEVVEGFTFDKGYVSPYFVTDAARMEAVYDKVSVVITDRKIASNLELLPILEKLAQSGHKEVLIIADEVQGEALGTLVINKLKGMFNSVVVQPPAWGDLRHEIMEDIAILTGATVISEQAGYRLEDATLEFVGRGRRVIVTKDQTTIIDGNGDKREVTKRLKEINYRIGEATSEADMELLEKRRAALEGKVAIIKIGGATQTEIEEKKFRVDDAVHAVKAALAEGIVAGGGVTMLNLANQLEINTEGANMLFNALRTPFRLLMENSALAPDKWLESLAGTTGAGIDVNNPDKILDLKEAGIIDPTRVTREAIQNAVSIAGTAMTMGALIIDEPPKEPDPQGVQQI